MSSIQFRRFTIDLRPQWFVLENNEGSCGFTSNKSARRNAKRITTMSSRVLNCAFFRLAIHSKSNTKVLFSTKCRKDAGLAFEDLMKSRKVGDINVTLSSLLVDGRERKCLHYYNRLMREEKASSRISSDSLTHKIALSAVHKLGRNSEVQGILNRLLSRNEADIGHLVSALITSIHFGNIQETEYVKKSFKEYVIQNLMQGAFTDEDKKDIYMKVLSPLVYENRIQFDAFRSTLQFLVNDCYISMNSDVVNYLLSIVSPLGCKISSDPRLTEIAEYGLPGYASGKIASISTKSYIETPELKTLMKDANHKAEIIADIVHLSEGKDLPFSAILSDFSHLNIEKDVLVECLNALTLNSRFIHTSKYIFENLIVNHEFEPATFHDMCNIFFGSSLECGQKADAIEWLLLFSCRFLPQLVNFSDEKKHGFILSCSSLAMLALGHGVKIPKDIKTTIIGDNGTIPQMSNPMTQDPLEEMKNIFSHAYYAMDVCDTNVDQRQLKQCLLYMRSVDAFFALQEYQNYCHTSFDGFVSDILDLSFTDIELCRSSCKGILMALCTKERWETYFPNILKMLTTMKKKNIALDNDIAMICLTTKNASHVPTIIELLYSMIEENQKDIKRKKIYNYGLSQILNCKFGVPNESSSRDIWVLMKTLYAEMQVKGITPNRTTYDHVLSLAERCHLCDEAQVIWHEMETAKIDPGPIGLLSMLKLLHNRKSYSDILQIMEKGGMKISAELHRADWMVASEIIQITMQSHIALNKWDDAIHLFYWLKLNNTFPTYSSHSLYYFNKARQKNMYMPVQNIRLYATALEAILANVQAYNKRHRSFRKFSFDGTELSVSQFKVDKVKEMSALVQELEDWLTNVSKVRLGRIDDRNVKYKKQKLSIAGGFHLRQLYTNAIRIADAKRRTFR